MTLLINGIDNYTKSFLHTEVHFYTTTNSRSDRNLNIWVRLQLSSKSEQAGRIGHNFHLVQTKLLHILLHKLIGTSITIAYYMDLLSQEMILLLITFQATGQMMNPGLPAYYSSHWACVRQWWTLIHSLTAARVCLVYWDAGIGNPLSVYLCLCLY